MPHLQPPTSLASHPPTVLWPISLLRPWWSLIARLAALLLATPLLFLYSANSWTALVLFLLILGGFWLRTDWRDAALITGSLALIAFGLEMGLGLLGLDLGTIDYRPHDRLKTPYGHYQTNQSVQMRMPYGDLIARAPSLANREDLKEPRDILFITDSWGYRNREPLGRQLVVLVGDSFVAGLADSQDDLLDERLAKDHGIHAYNMGYPAGPAGYAARIHWLDQQGLTPRPRIWVFFFEGNDFPDATEPYQDHREPVYRPEAMAWGRHFIRLFQDTTAARFLFGLTTRARETWREKQTTARPMVTIGAVGGQPMGFLTEYLDTIRRREFQLHPLAKDGLNKILDQADCCFFVPDKYRVYRPWLDDPVARQEVLPNAQWEFLAQRAVAAHKPAIDLTEALTREAGRLLPQGITLYWRDDSHWNRHGMAMAARTVAASVCAQGLKP